MKRATKHYHYSMHANGKPTVVCRVPASAGPAIARKVGVALARVHRSTMTVSNPTLVHHGKAARASHHIVTGDASRTAVADLYFVGDETAQKIAQAIANATKLSLAVIDNTNHAHGFDSPSAFVSKAKRVRRNPEGAPKPGEIWALRRGVGTAKIVKLDGRRVVATDRDTGNTDWHDLERFTGAYKFKSAPLPMRRNKRKAARKGRKHNPGRDYHKRTPTIGSYWTRNIYPQHIARVTGTERASGGQPPMVSLDIVTGRGQVMGTTRIPVNVWAADYSPMASDSPYRKTLPNKRRRRAKPRASKRPSLTRKRQNPRKATEREQAEATFKKWHEFDSSKVTRMKGPGRVIPKTLVHLGKLISVVYESSKYTGKPTLYEHKTKRPHPVLAADPAGRHVHIVGGRMRITGDGLVN